MTNIISNQIQRITLVLILAVFFFLKLEDCYLPYYWDELGVYSQAALYMFDHTPSLLPGDIPDVLSRGHPLLFMFIYSCYFKAFGTSIFGVHIFTCLISVSFIAASYRLAERHFSANIALLSAALLIAQPLFFTQSIFVLPEIMLGLFSLLAIYYYLEKRILISSICATLAVLTKETGVVLPLVIAVMESVRLYRKEIHLKKFIFTLATAFIPYYIFCLFIIVQRIQNGWFFYPYHTGFISFSPETIYWRLRSFLEFIFTKQGRITWLLLSLLFLLLTIFRNIKNISTRIKTIWKEFPGNTTVIIVFLIYLLGTLSYSALNFPMQRYLLMIYPIFSILIVWLVFLLTKRKILYTYGIILLFIAINLFYMKSAQRMVENDMAYKDLLKIQMEIAHYFDTKELSKKTIAADFPVTSSFFDPRLGYVNQTSYHLIPVPNEFETTTADYLIYTNPGILEEKKIIHSDKLQLIKELHEGAAEGYIYKVLK